MVQKSFQKYSSHYNLVAHPAALNGDPIEIQRLVSTQAVLDQTLDDLGFHGVNIAKLC